MAVPPLPAESFSCERAANGLGCLVVHRRDGPVIAARPQASSDAEITLPAEDAPQPASWAADLTRSGQFSLTGLAVCGAATLDGAELEQATARAYRALAGRQRQDPPWHAVRIWNFVPGILSDAGEGLDRYMRFNVGRYRAFCQWFGGTDEFNRLLPVASAVGHAGDDLIIHALWCRNRGTTIDNPRQHAPFCYSRRFGPLPPCFARATLLDVPEEKLLLVGGTASVRGEETVHAGDLAAQLRETFDNLSAVARRAWRLDEPLGCYRQLRVYYVRDQDLGHIKTAVFKRFPRVRRVEFMQADLCRPDLLVEIEGLAARSNARQGR